MLRKLILLTLLALTSSAAFAQGLRWDLGAPGSAGAVTVTNSGGLPPLLAQPGVTLAFCNFPANAVPCTNYAVTYTDQTAAFSCPSTAPIVLQGSTTCQATSDNYGNMGVFVLPNGACGGSITCYAYTLTVNGVSSGPYIWTQAATSVNANFASPPPIGSVVPNTGAFSGLSVSGLGTAGNGFQALPPVWPYLAIAPDPQAACAYPLTTFTTGQEIFCTFGFQGYVNFGQGNEQLVTTLNGNPSPGQVPTFQAAQSGIQSGYVAISPILIDATNYCAGGFNQYTTACNGQDACYAISQAINVGQGLSSSSVIDARRFAGNYQYCSAANATLMFFGGQTVYSAVPSVFLQGSFDFVIDGPTNGTNYTDSSIGPGGPSGVGTPSILVPSNFIWEGVNYNSSGVTVCTGAGTPISQCTHAFPQRSLGTITSITMSGTTATVNLSSGTLTAIACSPTCSGNIAVGERFQIVGAATQAANITGVVQSVSSTTSFTFNAEAGSVTCNSTCGGTVYLGTPVIGLAAVCASPCTSANMGTYLPGNQFGTALQGFNQIIEHLSVNEQGNQADSSNFTGYGVIGFQNDNGGDQGKACDLEFHYNTFIAFDLGPGSTDYHYCDLRTTSFTDTHIVPSSLSLFHAASDRGIDGFGFIEGPTSGTVNTQNASTGGCSANCVTWESGTKFSASWGSGTPFCIAQVCTYTISSVQSTTLLTLTGSPIQPGTQTGAIYQANQAWTAVELDGIRSAFIGTTTLRDGHAEATYDGIRIAGNNACRGCKITGFTGSPTGAHASPGAMIRIMKTAASSALCQGCRNDGLRQSSVGTYMILDDANSDSCTDLALSRYDTDANGLPITSCVTPITTGITENGTGVYVNGNSLNQVAHFSAIPSSDTLSSAGTFATTLSIPNTGLQIGSMITVKASGIYTTTGTANPLMTFDVNAGGTSQICPTGARTLATSVTTGYWDLTCYIQIQTTGTGGTAQVWGSESSAGQTGLLDTTTGIGFFYTQGSLPTYNTTATAESVSIHETSAMVSGQTFQLLSFDTQVNY